MSAAIAVEATWQVPLLRRRIRAAEARTPRRSLA
jgi:hypothetical protein